MITFPWLFIAALYTINPISLSVWPGFAQVQPATFTFVVRIQRDPQNRTACFVTDGPERRSSCWLMDGQSQQSYRFERTFRVGGEYEATAIVTRDVQGQEQSFTEARPFRVIGPEF